jgi:hypothetical protein
MRGIIKIEGKAKIDGYSLFGGILITDPDAAAYITAVEAADGEALETAVKAAYALNQT